MSEDIRSLIREVLAEELKTLRVTGKQASAPAPQNRVETISIGNDSDLNAFVKKILDLVNDDKTCADIKAGRIRFQLAGRQSTSDQQNVATAASVTFEKGLISEKKIADLPEGSTIRATKAVCFTPLALDEIRRKRISVERMKK